MNEMEVRQFALTLAQEGERSGDMEMVLRRAELYLAFLQRHSYAVSLEVPGHLQPQDGSAQVWRDRYKQPVRTTD